MKEIKGTVEQLLKSVQKAQKEFSTYTQEQVDKIFYAAAKAANAHRVNLAKMAVKETGMGIIEDKIIKNHVASEFIHNKYKDMQTVGVYEKDDGMGYEKMYEPMGVVGAIIPTTNPTSTAIFKTLISLKTRNGIIISPHPRAKQCTTEAARVIYEAAVEAGAPDGIIGMIDGGGFEAVGTLMRGCDVILATGGAGLVKAAYSSGTPAIGVGAGNCPAIIDTTADLPMAVASIIQSNTFDNGVVCATENSVIALEDNYDAVIAEFKKQYAYVVTDKEDIAKIGKGMFKEGNYGLLNADMVGQTPQGLAKVFGIKVPAWAKMMVVPAVGTGHGDPLAHEKLSTFVSIYKAKNFDDALKHQRELLEHGAGHTSSLFVDEEKGAEKINKFKNSAMTARLVVNSPSAFGGVGDIYNFNLEPSFTLGCGTWGGNIFSENIGPKHLLNKKEVTKRRENMLWLKQPERVYFKYGATKIALQDLKAEGIKKVMVVTDEIIFGLYGKKITSVLEEMGMDFRVFTDVEPNPSLHTCRKGAKALESFKAEAVIAFGGGSAIDAGKIMHLFYEYPETDFKDLALRFSDIQKRIVRYPNLGKKAKMICIPTTAGTGAEVTPFAVITDTDSHIKYPLADYALTPWMSITDAEFMMTMPRSITAATGMDALTHAFEAYVSALSNEFTDPYAEKAIKLLWEFLPRAVKNGAHDKEAREMVGHAATMAGIAFANAFLGIIHSLSHKIGGRLGVIHGVSNSILLPYVINYNAQQGVKEKQTYFSQFKTLNAREKYARLARMLGYQGKNEGELVDKLCKGIADFSKDLGVPQTYKEYGVKSKDFYDILDVMSEDSWDDQCTGANPRLPLISDMKDLFVASYEGTKLPKLG